MTPGAIILYNSSYEDQKYFGLVTKKVSRGYWVMWCDGTHKVLPKSLLKHTVTIQE